MGDVVSFFITVLDKYVIWIYLVLFIVSLIYFRNLLIARRNRSNSPYTIEREVAAHKEGKALTGIGVMLAMAAAVAAVKMFVLPGIDVTSLSSPTPTLTLPAATKIFATLTPAPTNTRAPAELTTPLPTKEPTVSVEETPTAAPRPTSAPPPASCPSEGVQISSPGSGATVSGQVTVMGTANINDFQFYKLEYSSGDQPGGWNVFGDLHYQAVNGGALGVFNSAALANGTYWLQLTVVDQTGNFPAPCQVRISISN
ncbi:MAG: hypothetical protein ACYC6L_13135 [Anaerolineae bacterium]